MMEQQISSSDGGPEQQSDLHRAPDACERASLLVPYPPRPTCARYRNPWGVLHAEVGTSITDSWNSWFAPESEKVFYGTWPRSGFLTSGRSWDQTLTRFISGS